MLVKQGIVNRRDLWAPLVDEKGEERWSLFMGVLGVQGFSETNSADVKRAQEALTAAGLGSIEDELQLRLLRVLHLFYIPNIEQM